MNPADIDLDALLRRLHLPTIRRLYADYAVRAAAEGWSHRDLLAVLIAEEVAHRNDTRIAKGARFARFPFVKSIESFDFIFQSTLRRQRLGPYLGPELVTEGRNLILSGRPDPTTLCTPRYDTGSNWSCDFPVRVRGLREPDVTVATSATTAGSAKASIDTCHGAEGTT